MTRYAENITRHMRDLLKSANDMERREILAELYKQRCPKCFGALPCFPCFLGDERIRRPVASEERVNG